MVSDKRLEYLSEQMNTLMGESVASFIINSELSRINYSSEDINDLDYDLLLENLQSNLVPFLGEAGTKWLFEELAKKNGIAS